MVLSMEQYEVLRKDFLDVAECYINSVTLNELKSHYAKAINSVRTLDRIQDIENLVRVLEKRGVIRYNNIIPLKHIARNYFKGSPINEKLNQYDVWLKSYIPHYPPHTNLYRLSNGEFYLRNRCLNDLSSTNSKKRSFNDLNLQSHLEYQFAYKLPLGLISNEDLSNCDNSILSTNSQNDQSNAKVLFQSSLSSNDNHDIKNINENYDDRKVQIVHNVTIPSNLAFKSEQTLVFQKNCLTPLLVEENLKENNIIPKTSALPTLPSLESQTICSSQFNNTLSDQSLLNLSQSQIINKKISLKKLMQTRQVWIGLIILFLAVLLITLFIIYNLLEHPVQYNPEPSAPPFQTVNSGSTETSGNPFAGNHSNGVTDFYQQSHEYLMRTATCFPVIPRLSLHALSKVEQTKQQIVFERVSQKLGSYWQDVARILGVMEDEIDQIERHNCSLRVKAFTALKIFARDVDPVKWQKKLKKALEKARRKDLAEMVEDLLSRR